MGTPFDPNNPSAQPPEDDGEATLPYTKSTAASEDTPESASADTQAAAPISEDDMPTIRVSPIRTPQPDAVTPIAAAETPVAGAGEAVSIEATGAAIETPTYAPPPPPPSYTPPAPAFNPASFADAATTTAEQQPFAAPPPPALPASEPAPAPSFADAATVAATQVEPPASSSSTEDTIASEDAITGEETILAAPTRQAEPDAVPLIEHVPAQSAPDNATPPSYGMYPPAPSQTQQGYPSPDYQISLSPEAVSAPVAPTPAQGFQAPPPAYAQPAQPGMPYPPPGQFAAPPAYPPSGQFAPQAPQAPQAGFPPSGQFAAPPMPPQAPQYMAAPMAAGPVVIVQNNANSNKTTAIILEIVGGLFGVFGIGWLNAGKSKVGVPLLIGSIVWILIEIIGSILTIGFGLLCFFPIDVIALVVSTIMLNNSFNQSSNVAIGFGAAPGAPMPPYQGYAPPPQYPQAPPAQPYQSAPQYPQTPPTPPTPPQYPQ